MNRHSGTTATLRLLLCVGLALTITWLLLTGLHAVQAHEQNEPLQRVTAILDRPEDPIVLKGAQLAAFSDAPLNELVAYAFHGGVWTPIPFQIDEVTISGTYVISDGGRLDANDELVFMAGDAGESVSAAAWPDDTQARLAPRMAITVTDPLSAGQQAWVYLYRSATLTRSTARYITWTQTAQTASAISYTAAFSPTKFVGLSDLFINGGTTDILDRQKTRLATFTTLNEETLVTFLGAATVTLPITGPVRAVTNNGDLKAAFYGSRLDFGVTFNIGGLPLVINSIRTSFDWISPTISGIHTYYDSNTPGGAAIDGVTDAISTTPHNTWFQVNGNAGGPGGLVMVIPQIDPAGGTVANYYKDNGTLDSGDTGDKRSYGDAGLKIDQPGTVVSFTLSTYILPPGAHTNVGAAYLARAWLPLQAATTEQCYAPAGRCLRLYLPLMLK